MFEVQKQPTIKFNSEKANKKLNQKSSTSTQTDQRKTLDKEVQIISIDDKSIQVNLERNLSTSNSLNFNANKLKKFLDYASDLTINEIRESILVDSNLKYIELMNNVNEELNPDFCYLPSKSTTNDIEGSKSLNKEESVGDKLRIEHLIWSSNLNQLIIGFSVPEHTYWCSHSSRIEFCNLYQRSDKKPNLLKVIFKMQIKNCITKMISHPKIFTQLAVGTKAGTISIIDRDLAKQDSSTFLDQTSNAHCIKHESNQHKLEITYLAFKKSNLDKNSSDFDELLSCSLDGKIIVWKIKQFEKQLQPLKVFNLNNERESTKQIQLGIKCASLSVEQDSILIGSENYLYSTSLNLKSYSNELNVDFEYEKHKGGEIKSIENFSLNRNFFLTNGEDGEARLYEMNKRSPLLTIYLDKKQFDFKWINIMKRNKHQYLVGLDDNGLLIVNIYKKDTNYFTTNQPYFLKDKYSKLFISQSNQLGLVNSADEIYLFDLNILFDELDDGMR